MQIDIFTAIAEATHPVIVHSENNVQSQAHFEANEPKFNKQCKTVYEALKRGERLTVMSAMMNYGIGDLRRRCKDLRDTFQIPVSSEYVSGGHKEYFLAAHTS